VFDFYRITYSSPL
jgi:hypothetical protein